MMTCGLTVTRSAGRFFFFSRIRFSFRIFKMRGFVSPAVHHSNAYPAQSCKSATLTRVTTGSQHDFIMP